MKHSHRLYLALLMLMLILGSLLAESLPPAAWPLLGERFQVFVTILLGIFLEAAPFLLAGSLVSGLIQVFLDQSVLSRWTPRQPALAALAGALLGLAFPVCECGVVPVMRRLHQKGLPLSAGVAFLLAAPIVNPVVIASTYSAFGWGPMLWARVGLALLIAFAVGLLFSVAKPDEVLLPDAQPQACEVGTHAPSLRFSQRLPEALAAAGDDFMDMARYLIAGSMLAAAMQTLVPQAALLAVGRGPVSSVIALLALAFVLSVCSTVDAFLALAFANTFAPAAVLGFLVFGPMVDIKSSLMFLRVFRRRAVIYLILLPLVMTLVVAVYLSLNVRW